MTTETVLLLWYLGMACIGLRFLWLVHEALAQWCVALLRSGARWLDTTNREAKFSRRDRELGVRE